MIGADHRCWDRRSSRLSPWRRRFYHPDQRTSRRPRSRGSTGGGSRRGANTPANAGCASGVRPRSARGATQSRPGRRPGGGSRSGIRTRWGDARAAASRGHRRRGATGHGRYHFETPSSASIAPATFAVLLKGGATASRAPGYPAGSSGATARAEEAAVVSTALSNLFEPMRRGGVSIGRGEDDVREGDVYTRTCVQSGSSEEDGEPSAPRRRFASGASSAASCGSRTTGAERRGGRARADESRGGGRRRLVFQDDGRVPTARGGTYGSRLRNQLLSEGRNRPRGTINSPQNWLLRSFRHAGAVDAVPPLAPFRRRALGPARPTHIAHRIDHGPRAVPPDGPRARARARRSARSLTPRRGSPRARGPRVRERTPSSSASSPRSAAVARSAPSASSTRRRPRPARESPLATRATASPRPSCSGAAAPL